jgi:tRNA pseudouridine55 synthase
LELDVHCGKGTYIRSIARDLGRALGVGGYVTVLCRLAIGPFTVETAVPPDAAAETARGKLLPMAAAVAGMSTVQVSEEYVRRLRNGQAIPTIGTGETAVLDPAGGLVAVGRADGGWFKPEKVIAG